MVIVRAGIAEILRASQKDDFVIRKVQQMAEEIFLAILGPRMLMKYKQSLEAATKFIYFGNTTLCGIQTLGEEYTGIIQVNGTLNSVPSFMTRLVMVLMQCFGFHVTTLILNKFETNVNKNEEIRTDAKQQILWYIFFLRKMFPIVELLHKTVFFCDSKMFEISKRLTDVNYVLLRHWLKDRDRLGFRLMGILTLINLILNIIHAVKEFSSKTNEMQSSGRELFGNEACVSSKKCTMCLNGLRYPTSTMCGHVFCWKCILDWLQDQEKCPICRERVVPSRLIPLMNY